MTDRAIAIIRKLSSAFRQDKGSNNYKIIKIPADELDEIAAVVESIVQAHNIDLATGQSLDNLADLLELDRSGLSDNDFKSLISATAGFRRSNGTITDIKNVVSTITGVLEEDIVVHEDGGTSFSIEIQKNQRVFSLTNLNQNINSARAAGVKYLSDDLVFVLTPALWESHVTRDGAAWTVGKIVEVLISEYTYGNSAYGNGPYGDPCETDGTSAGTIVV